MEDLKEVGLSLFQGAESILVDKNNQRHEEEEDLEDRQRRHEEVMLRLLKFYMLIKIRQTATFYLYGFRLKIF